MRRCEHDRSADGKTCHDCGHVFAKPAEQPPEVRRCPHGNALTSYCGSCDDDGWHAAAKQNALSQPPEVPVCKHEHVVHLLDGGPRCEDCFSYLPKPEVPDAVDSKFAAVEAEYRADAPAFNLGKEIAASNAQVLAAAKERREVPAPDEMRFRMARALLGIQARKRGGKGGQMFTAYACAMCEDECSAPSTCTPLLCPLCEGYVRAVVRAREGGR